MNIVDHFDSLLSLSEGEVPVCTGCKKKVDGDKLKSCSACFKAKYCSRECQKKDWKMHKKVCVNAKTPLRFTVGDRVRCAAGGEWTPWKKGTIVGLFMFDDKNPYAIQCDNGEQLRAPEDTDIFIQKIPEECFYLAGADGKPLTPITAHNPAKDPAAELRQEALFKESPPEEDCPICNIRFPMKNETCTLVLSNFSLLHKVACCGKSLCIGCHMVQDRDKCPLCGEDLQHFNAICRLFERIHHSCNDQDKIRALDMLASSYDTGAGGIGVRQDSKMAHQLWMEAVELGGSKEAHYNLSQSYSKYHKERGVEKDDKKELYHLEEAAMLGDAAARCELGCYEGDRGNWDRAKKHWMLSAAAGCEGCMEMIKRGKKKGAVSSDEYKKTLRAHRKSLNLTRSAQRDAARERLNLKVGPGGVRKM
eukprot:scaffold16617_cov136-Skeletonema_dohrnii-CCMP3373.AAC.2